MPIDFTLNDNQRRLRREAHQFAKDVLSGVPVATRDLPSPIERFVATRPFYERLVAEGFLRKCIPVSVGVTVLDWLISLSWWRSFIPSMLTSHSPCSPRCSGLRRWWLAANQSSTNGFCRPFLRPRVHRLPHSL